MTNVFENEYAKFWVEDSILIFKYKRCSIIGVETAKIIVADRLAFQNEKAYPILCDVRRIEDSDKAARDYLAKEGSALTIAVSFLVQPLMSKAMAKFYVQNNQPTIPSGIFTDRAKAIQFLKSYK